MRHIGVEDAAVFISTLRITPWNESDDLWGEAARLFDRF